MPTTAAGLSSLMSSAAADLTSAHIQVELNIAGAPLSGTGVEQLSAGKVTALDLTANLAGVGAIHVIIVDGKTYVQLPTSMNPGGKPYLSVTPDSSNATIHELAPYLDAALIAVSPASLSTLAGAAKSIEVKGTQTINGVLATHYVIEVDLAKLPASFPGKDQLAAGGPSVPLDLYVARDGKATQADLRLDVLGQPVPIVVKFSDYNTPVSITAPPAAEVGQ